MDRPFEPVPRCGRATWPTALPPCAALLIAAFLAGCNKPPAVNPWRDDSIPDSVLGTAASELILSQGAEPVLRQHYDFPSLETPVVSGAVPHYPLWWEDPFEDQGDNNDQFAWTWQDYFDMPYGLGRFILNTMGWPVSAVVTPPGTPMVSDGVVEGVHDAKRGVVSVPTGTAADFQFPARPPEPVESLPPELPPGSAESPPAP